MPKPIRGNSRYMAGLDGLRAIAVLGVIAYHLNLSFLPGGFLGVGVFFVLSGYLISNLLSAEWEKNDKIDFKNFWAKRARRLFPALLIMVVLIVGYITLFLSNRLPSIKGDTISSILYYNNWYLIFRHVSYFAKFGPPSPFGHMWSLSVEGQFYLIWPLLIVLGFRYIKNKNMLFILTVILALTSAIAMTLIYKPGVDPSRVYYGTDTRAFALLIGSALALIWPSQKLKENIKKKQRIFLDSIGIIGLIIVILMFFVINEYDPFLYQGGMLVLTIATAVLIASLAHPSTIIGKALGCKPLRWLGARSYGIYLWHYPIIALTNPLVNTHGINIWRVILQVSASIIVAAISWKYVEEPIRHGALKNIWSQFNKNSRNNSKLTGAPIKTWAILATSAIVFGIFFISITGIAPIVSTSASKLNSTSNEHTTEKDITNKTENENTTMRQNSSDGTFQNTKEAAIEDGNGVTAIGDSILLDAEPYLKEFLPGIFIDGKIGRQVYQAQDVVNQLKKNGNLGKRVIIELGTNGSFTEKQLTSLLQSLGPVQQIILVNVRVPRPWESLVNETLAKVAAKFPHTTLVDWYSASAGHDSFFSPDAVHLEPSGAKYFASIVAKYVEPAKKNKQNATSIVAR